MKKGFRRATRADGFAMIGEGKGKAKGIELWRGQPTYMVATKTKTTSLAVVIVKSSGTWSMMAITTPNKTKGVSGVLENHAHENLGDAPTLPQARKHAAAYAMAWRNGKPTPPKCGCGEISADKPRKVAKPTRNRYKGTKVRRRSARTS